ncbi:hypothetical protein HK101_005092 [Irineochytrium annulatum]|nr:hypothetical protein HK101_005092 [Irineochytrium annulatum]
MHDIYYYIIGILYLIFDLEIIFLFPLGAVFLMLDSIVTIGLLYLFFTLLTWGFIYEWNSGVLLFMAILGIQLALGIYIMGLVIYLLNKGRDLIMLLISLELIFLAIGILFIHLTFYLDDIIGYYLTLYLLPLAGGETAIILALLVAYHPLRGSISFHDDSHMN